METITLTGRNSSLSLLQIETVKQKIESAFPGIEVKVKPRSTRGDELQHIPLQTVEGTDFFTEDIFHELESGDADIAVHSLKDMSAQHFFGGNIFSVVDRDDVRDVVIFQKDIISKISLGAEIVIGTCSPRREHMAIRFLQKALPQLHPDFKVKTKIIRGNVDTRLRKLDVGEYDGIILAAAGLNRLLRSAENADSIRKFLQDKRLIVLPLIECVPAPCQGAIVAETLPQNKKAQRILNRINDEHHLNRCSEEKKIALRYGAGCDQKFGVTTVAYGEHESFYSAGEDGNKIEFENWHNLPDLKAEKKIIYNASNLNQELFDVEPTSSESEIEQPVVFVSNDKAVGENLLNKLRSKRVWAAGTKTWQKLAKKGIWVEGCADALGLEMVTRAWETPVVQINRQEVLILTNETGAANWTKKGWNARGTYKTEWKENWPKEKVQSADIIFVTSYHQYQKLKPNLRNDVTIVCPYGETAVLLKESGVEPVIFPTIKSFEQWKTNTHSPIEG